MSYFRYVSALHRPTTKGCLRRIASSSWSDQIKTYPCRIEGRLPVIYLSGYLPILIDLESEVIFSEASAELDNHLRLPPSSSSRVCTWNGQVIWTVALFGGNKRLRVAVEIIHKLLFQVWQEGRFQCCISGELSSGLGDRSVWQAIDNEFDERWMIMANCVL